MQVLTNAIRTGFLVAIISLGVGSAAVAGPFEDGLEAYYGGDYQTALRLLQPLADQGHAGAQHNLGYMHHFGNGVPENDAEAYKWYNLAAAQGHKDAKTNKYFIEKTWTREQIAEAQRLSAEWKPISER